MEKVTRFILRLFGGVHIDEANRLAELMKEYADKTLRNAQLIVDLQSQINELQGRIEDLEAAYPDYNKAKEQAEENKAKEIVPGFRPFSQRKRAWEAQHRKPAEKK